MTGIGRLLCGATFLAVVARRESRADENVADAIRSLQEQVTALLQHRQQDYDALEGTLKRAIEKNTELFVLKNELKQLRKEVAFLRGGSGNEAKNERLRVRWLGSAVTELQGEVAEVLRARNASEEFAERSSMKGELALLKGDVAAVGRGIRNLGGRIAKIDAVLGIVRLDIAAVEERFGLLSRTCSDIASQLTSVQIEAKSSRCESTHGQTAAAAAASTAQRIHGSKKGCTASCSAENESAVVTIQPKNDAKHDESSKLLDNAAEPRSSFRQVAGPGSERATPAAFSRAKDVCQAVDSMTRVIKSNSGAQRNKFTEGLDFATIVDWTSELRPSMKKLRQAMDGLLKTARLTHSVFRVQEDAKMAQRACNVRYRRDVCFSQALTSLVSGLMAKLWCQRPDPMFLLILTTLGPLVSFEGLLSYYGDEIDMWGDMAVAVEDMHTVTFALTRCGIRARLGGSCNVPFQEPVPRVVGSRAALTVILPVPDAIYSLLPVLPSSRQTISFNVTPVFFNVGINEMASLAESLGTTKPQEKSNLDNFDRLNEYYLRFKKLSLPTEASSTRLGARSPLGQTLAELVASLKTSVQSKVNKNVEILQLSSRICRRMRGLRFTSCKSAKDRTGMSITLEQVNVLSAEYHLAEHEYTRALDCMRSEGCRRENTWKNIGVRKYAFNSLQILTFPKLYRPPTGTYGSAQT